MASALPLAMSCIVIGGGHGIGLLGMFALWRIEVQIGLGIYVLIATFTGLIRTDVVRCSILLACLVVPLALWTCTLFLLFADWLIASLLTSIPFLALASVLAIHVMKGLNEAPPIVPRR